MVGEQLYKTIEGRRIINVDIGLSVREEKIDIEIGAQHGW